jgi:hypothetical protein
MAAADTVFMRLLPRHRLSAVVAGALYLAIGAGLAMIWWRQDCNDYAGWRSGDTRNCGGDLSALDPYYHVATWMLYAAGIVVMAQFYRRGRTKLVMAVPFLFVPAVLVLGVILIFALAPFVL